MINLTTSQVLKTLELFPDVAYAAASILTKIPATNLPREGSLFADKQTIENTVGTFHKITTGVKPDKIRFKDIENECYSYFNNKSVVTDIERLYSQVVASIDSNVPVYRLVDINEEDLKQAVLVYLIVEFEDEYDNVFKDTETTHEIVESDKFKQLTSLYLQYTFFDIEIKPSQNDWLLAIERKREIFTCN